MKLSYTHLFAGTAILVLIVASNYAQIEMIPRDCRMKNRSTMRGLDESSPLFQALKEGATGDAIDYPWRGTMAGMGIHQAVGSVRVLDREGKVILSLEGIKYYRKYYFFSGDSPIKASPDSVAYRSLTQDLTAELLTKAKKILSRTNSAGDHCGTVYINLLDDACLPELNPIPEWVDCDRSTDLH